MQLTTACGCYQSDNQIHSSQLKTSLLESFCASLNMRDIYLVQVINNFQAKVLRVARDRMAQTPHRCPSYSVKRKLAMMSTRRIRLQQVKDLPMRSAMKARMTMFKLSKLSTRTTTDHRKRPDTALTKEVCPPGIPSSAEGQFLQSLAGCIVSTTTCTCSATPISSAVAINTCKP